jgi:hypothetical protein
MLMSASMFSFSESIKKEMPEQGGELSRTETGALAWLDQKKVLVPKDPLVPVRVVSREGHWRLSEMAVEELMDRRLTTGLRENSGSWLNPFLTALYYSSLLSCSALQEIEIKSEMNKRCIRTVRLTNRSETYGYRVLLLGSTEFACEELEVENGYRLKPRENSIFSITFMPVRKPTHEAFIYILPESYLLGLQVSSIRLLGEVRPTPVNESIELSVHLYEQVEIRHELNSYFEEGGDVQLAKELVGQSTDHALEVVPLRADGLKRILLAINLSTQELEDFEYRLDLTSRFKASIVVKLTVRVKLPKPARQVTKEVLYNEPCLIELSLTFDKDRAPFCRKEELTVTLHPPVPYLRTSEALCPIKRGPPVLALVAEAYCQVEEESILVEVFKNSKEIRVI